MQVQRSKVITDPNYSIQTTEFNTPTGSICKAEDTFALQKGADTYVQLHQPKKWLEEAEAQVSKIKPKGLDHFLAEYLRVIFKGWPHREKVASPG